MRLHRVLGWRIIAGAKFSVGAKLVIGVGLVSNLCMGVLLYTNFQASGRTETKTRALMELSAGLNADLRARILALEKKYLEIPGLLEVDPGGAIEETLKQDFPLEEEKLLAGRSEFGAFFKRRERRDLARGRVVAKIVEGRLIVARGLLDKTGTFSQKVRMLGFASDTPEQDLAAVKDIIARETAAADSGEALTAKISQLKSALADEGLAAEASRTQILYHVDQIKAGKSDLMAFRKKQHTTSLIITVATIVLNILVLYAMTAFLVEGPLRRLTRVIKEINSGEDVAVPYQRRRDRIGVLAGVLASFKDALQDLKNEDLRKAGEQRMIQELIHTITDLIEDLRGKSQSMKSASVDLHGLASDTSDQGDSAAKAVARTEEAAGRVSDAAEKLQAAVGNIERQVESQNGLVREITRATGLSMEKIDTLNHASEEIRDIIKLVKNISGKTKLLALNARIEASRAGTAGKGFAVVANEVKDLSLQTETANQDIEARILAIGEACASITEATRGVEHLGLDLSETGNRIQASIQEQKRISDRLTLDSAGTRGDAGDMAERLMAVKEAAGQTRHLSDRVRSYSTDMEAALDDLLTSAREQLSRVGGSSANTSLTIC